MSVLTVAQRWPSEVCPETCEFGRSRNDILQRSSTSRQEFVVRRGRPLWTATLTWDLTITRERTLRYWLDTLQGHRGSVILWDFKAPFPAERAIAMTLQASPSFRIQPLVYRTWLNGTNTHLWVNSGSSFYWTNPMTTTVGMTSVTLSIPPQALATPILRQGDYIQLKRRLYIVASDVTTSPGVPFVIVPLTTPILDELVNTDDVRIIEAGCEMMMVSQDWSSSRSAGNAFSKATATFIETTSNYSPTGRTFA